MSADFRRALERELSGIVSRYGLAEDKAFLMWFPTAILEIEDHAASDVWKEGCEWEP